MIEWLRTVVQIMFLQAGPQDLPAGRSSLILAFTLYWAVIAIVTISVDDSRGAGLMLLSFALQVTFVLGVLHLFGRHARFSQTATALFSTAALMGLINLPLWMMAEPPIPTSLAMLILAGLFWSLAIDGSIWRHALERSFGFGLSIAVFLFAIHFVIMQNLSPPVTAG